MPHELVAFPNGSFSVKPHDSEEAMHSHIGPWQEAHSIYVEQSGLAERLRESGPPLVLFDLGMGIAANALAAITCFKECGPKRKLRVLSFEKHLDGVKLALENVERFPWIEEHRQAIEDLVSHRPGLLPDGLSWQLIEGDYLDEIQKVSARADLIFFDFYSPKANPELWGRRCFEATHAATAAHARLVTYGASTAARASMLLAGFFVGVGRATLAKTETTVAATHLEDLERPLGPEWLAKLERSEKPLPQDCASRAQAFEKIRAHPQFKPRSPS